MGFRMESSIFVYTVLQYKILLYFNYLYSEFANSKSSV